MDLHVGSNSGDPPIISKPDYLDSASLCKNLENLVDPTSNSETEKLTSGKNPKNLALIENLGNSHSEFTELENYPISLLNLTIIATMPGIANNSLSAIVESNGENMEAEPHLEATISPIFSAAGNLINGNLGNINIS